MAAKGPSSRAAGRCATVALGIAGVAGLGAGPPRPAAAATAPSPSAVGSAWVAGITVSPAYAATGLVIATVIPTVSCHGSCAQLWASHDGGATWTHLLAAGWDAGIPVIALDGSGQETLYAGSSTLKRSDDGGATWTAVGAQGTPTVSPTYPSDHSLGVASPSGDYVLRNGSASPVTGSAGSIKDVFFTYAPAFPAAGPYPSALLSGTDGNGRPAVMRCTADLTCRDAATIPGGLPMAGPLTLAPSTAYASDGVVFAQDSGGVYKSSDGGRSFGQLAVGAADATAVRPLGIALAPQYREAGPVRTVYAAVVNVYGGAANGQGARTSGGVYRSGDGGTTWTVVGPGSPLDKGATAVSVAPDGRLFAGYFDSTTGHAGLLCTGDSVQWQASCLALTHAAAGSGTSGGSSASPGGGSCPVRTCPASGVAAHGDAAGRPATATGTAPQPGGSGAPGGAAAAELPAAATPVTPAAASPGRSPLALIALGVGGVAVLGVLGGLLRARRRRSTA